MSAVHTIVNAEAIAETDKAVLVEAPELDEAIWVPKSVIDDDSEVYERGTEGDLIVAEWWATKQGLT